MAGQGNRSTMFRDVKATAESARRACAYRMLLTVVLLLPFLAAGPGVAAPTARPTCEKPSELLDLESWKLQLPTGDDERPDEVTQPELDEFVSDPWFVANEACDGVRFRAAVNGVTTSGSDYPRSELREMSADGSGETEWSTTEGTHSMVVEAAITQLPAEKPEVVAAQVHGGDDDLTTIRLEGTSLYVSDPDSDDYQLITDDYRLGTPFKAEFRAADGAIEVYYNDTLQATVETDSSTAYFKTGAYTQANCENSAPCDETNYGEVEVYGVTVSHQE